MNDRVIVVTPQDDVLIKGPRILLVNLTSDQSKIVSDILLNIKLESTVILYAWNNEDPSEWLLDKVYKSGIIIFNAEQDTNITGFLSGFGKSYYFGNLKELSLMNPRTIYAFDDCKTLLDSYIGNYEQN
jgi:hypothetical protein